MKKTTVEYPDAPSGAIKLYNYKEPFMPTETGIGYQGVLLHDAVEDAVQCSLCGWWGKALSHHLRREHAMPAAQYKRDFGLSQKTVLMSEKYRTNLIKAAQETRAKQSREYKESLVRKLQRGKRKFYSSGKRQGGGNGARMESRNNLGACPAQLLDKISRLADEIQHAPSIEEFTKKYGAGTYASVRYVYGTYSAAVKLCGWEPLKRGECRTRHRVSEKELLERLRLFREKHQRDASWSDFNRKLIPSLMSYYRKFGSLKNAIALSQKV